MSLSRPEQLQNLIKAGRRMGWSKEELSDEELTRLYSRLFKRCEEKGGTESDDIDCHDVAFGIGKKRIIKDSPDSMQDKDIENRKGELGEQLKNKFDIGNLTEIDRWVASCVNGYITVLPGDKILSRMYCPVCHKRSWIDPHPEEVSKQKIDERTLKRLNRSETFLE